MQSNHYLYSYWKVPKIPQEVIDARIKILSSELREELGLMAYNQRIGKLLKAITFWENINND